MGRRIAPFILLALLLALVPGAARAAEAQRVVPSATAVKLTRGDQKALTALVLPEAADQRVVWRSSKPAVASVTADGVVTARKVGRTVLRVSSVSNPKVFSSVKLKVLKGATPTKVVLGADVKGLALGDSLDLEARVLPAAASQSLSYRSSNEKVATVSREGIVTALAQGEAVITVRSQAKTSVRKTITLAVYDPLTPYALAIGEDSGYLEKGASRALTYNIEPKTALGGVTWTSSAPTVVSVTGEGVIRALKPGRATITCKAQRGDASDTLTVVVLDGSRTTDIPARLTARSSAAVSANLKAIDRIYESAVSELDALAAAGEITQAEFGKRRAILINAFAMYRFPWYTTARVPYWTSEYKGKKDFYPDKAYYGLPYIQSGAGNNRVNRRYNVTKAVNQGYYTKAEGELYRITSKRMSSMYVGNDCSAFVCMAIFPANGVSVNSSVCFQITRDMLVSSTFRKVASYDDLRPGDLLTKSGHTVMFLYYTNTDRSRMMIIEQGGGNLTTDIHNTICCSVVNRASYEPQYKVLRASFLAK